MPTSALVGCLCDAEAPQVKPTPFQPDTPRPYATGRILADFGGSPGARVVLMEFGGGRTALRTLCRPNTTRPDHN